MTFKATRTPQGWRVLEHSSGPGNLLDNFDYADIHGQLKFNFKHAAIAREDSKRFLNWSFWRDFRVNGPSLYRIARTSPTGWKGYQDWPDARA